MALFGSTPTAPTTSPLSAVGGFLWGDGGQPLTPAQAQAQQEMAAGLIARQQAPRNLGEGLSAVGQALLAKSMMNRGTMAQAEGLAKATADFQNVMTDPSNAVNFLANDQFATPGQQAVAQALFTQKMMATNPQIQAQLANLASETAKNNAEAGMFANGGTAVGAPIQDAAGNYYVPTQYGNTMRPLSAPGQAAPAPTAAVGSPLANSGAVPTPASAGAADGVPATPVPLAAPQAVSAAASVPLATTPASTQVPVTAGGAGVFLTPAQREEAQAVATKTGEIKAALPQQMVAAKNSLDQLDQSDKLVSGFIDQAINEASGMGTTGWVGKLSEAIPGTPAYKLARTLDTVRANIGFDKLQAMRAASPSGGALGQVSNFEEQLLQAVLGSLDQGQDAPTIIANLQRLKGFTASNSAQRQAAFQADFGGVKPLSGDSTFNPAATGAAPVKISGDADFAALPSGAHFIGPDGKLRVKP